MNEIEVKILNTDVELVKLKLLELGGKLVKKELQENLCYDLPQHVENQNGFVRIRIINNLLKEETKYQLCSKKIISQSNCRITEENEFIVDNLEACINFVNSLELTLYRRSKKHRESYSYKDALIEIDTLDKDEFPNPYIEIEAKDEDTIFRVMDLLKIPRENATSKSLKEIKADIERERLDKDNY